MSLKDKITEEIKAAMKAKDKVRLETVRSIKKVILEEEVNARAAGKESLTEAQEMDILARLAKQRRDSIEQYTQVGRQELADQEAAELAIIEEYLPKQLSDDCIKRERERYGKKDGFGCHALCLRENGFRQHIPCALSCPT
uniref:GatB/YqeY domain-containing protein n=1 Tax=Okeania sp. SIO2F4 TaxID=2607790 RepID=UPI0025D229F9